MAHIHGRSVRRDPYNNAPQPTASGPVASGFDMESIENVDEGLLAELGPKTDLVALIKRVSQNQLPWVVVPSAAVTTWKRRDPAAWEKVSEWLAAKGVAIVPI